MACYGLKMGIYCVTDIEVHPCNTERVVAVSIDTGGVEGPLGHPGCGTLSSWRTLWPFA